MFKFELRKVICTYTNINKDLNILIQSFDPLYLFVWMYGYQINHQQIFYTTIYSLNMYCSVFYISKYFNTEIYMYIFKHLANYLKFYLHTMLISGMGLKLAIVKTAV